MNNKKSTKRALLSSVLSLVLCMAMLIGTTFAWFTDSVQSNNNIIKSGNLDVELEYSTDMATWTPVTSTTNVFKDGALWEPGYTEVVYLRVSNKGSLALKYQLGINIASETEGVNKDGANFKLSDYIEYGVVDNVTAKYADRPAARAAVTSASKLSVVYTKESSILANGAPHVVAMVVYMPESVGNEANHNGTQPVINLGINLYATQQTEEADSFDNQYDANATYPVASADELTSAVAEGKNVTLANDIALNDEVLSVAKGKDVTIDLNGNDITGIATAATTSNMVKVSTGATLTLKGEGTISSRATNPDTNWDPEGYPGYASNTIRNEGTLIVDGVTIENKTPRGGASYAIDNYAGSSLIVNSGTIKQSGNDVAIRIFTSSKTAEVNVTINGGTIEGYRAVWIHLAGSDSTVAPKVNLTINGGQLKSTDTNYNNSIYSYSYGNSFANTNVTITGGTFDGLVAFGGGYKGDTENVTVTGGTFNDGIGRYLAGDGWEDIAVPTN